MREPHKRDEPTAYRDPGPTMIASSTAYPPRFSATWCYLNPAAAAAEIEQLRALLKVATRNEVEADEKQHSEP